MPLTPSLKQSLAILLMASQLSSCTSWRLETASPRELVDNRHPAVVRVEQADGRREVLYRPEVQGDTLMGASYWESKTPDRALPLRDIKRLATQHVSSGRTAGLALGLSAFIGGIIFAATWKGPFGDCCQ